MSLASQKVLIIGGSSGIALATARAAAAAARTLVKKLGEPEEVAGAILFLIANGFVTGSVITVDGGLLLA